MKKKPKSITIPTTGRHSDLAVAFYQLASELDLDAAKAGRRAILLMLEKHGYSDGQKINPEFLAKAKAAILQKENQAA